MNNIKKGSKDFFDIAVQQLENGRAIITKENCDRFYIKVYNGDILEYRKMTPNEIIFSKTDIPRTHEEIKNFFLKTLNREIKKSNNLPLTNKDFETLRELIVVWMNTTSI